VQLISHLLDGGCNIQEAIEQPRFNFLAGDRVRSRTHWPPASARRSHAADTSWRTSPQHSWPRCRRLAGHRRRSRDRRVLGGSDPRKDGCAIGF
jgi:gamma-glutamyltranspeptidase